MDEQGLSRDNLPVNVRGANTEAAREARGDSFLSEEPSISTQPKTRITTASGLDGSRDDSYSTYMQGGSSFSGPPGSSYQSRIYGDFSLDEETSIITDRVYKQYKRDMAKKQQSGYNAQLRSSQAEWPGLNRPPHRCKRYTDVPESSSSVKIGQRVTWFSEEATAEHGVVAWVGRFDCKFISSDCILAGVIFVSVSFLLGSVFIDSALFSLALLTP